VLVATLVLVGVANLGAYAATGKPLILGKKNVASTSTTLVGKGNGATLRLLTAGEGAPLFVERNSPKVDNLDADRLDGESASEIGTEGYQVTLTPTARVGRVSYDIPVGLHYGAFYASYSVLAETTGTSVTCAWELGQIGRGNGVPTADGPFTVSGSVLLDGDDSARFFCETEPGQTISILDGSRLSALRLYAGKIATANPVNP
jgi:hypothetical protein